MMRVKTTRGPEIAGYYQAWRPWHERLWQRLGFGWCSAGDPWPEVEHGFSKRRLTVNTHVHLCWPDRLRLLLSGRLLVAVVVRTDVPVARSQAASKTSVLPPSRKP